MDTIPAEVLVEILGYLPEKHLGSIRLLGLRDSVPGKHKLKASFVFLSEWPTDDYMMQKALNESGVFAHFLKIALSEMVNVREITINLLREESKHAYVEPREWPERATLGDIPSGIGSKEAKQLLRIFEDLMTAASLANTRLHTLKTYCLWRGAFVENSKVLSSTQLLQNLTSLSIYFALTLIDDDFSTMNKEINQGRGEEIEENQLSNEFDPLLTCSIVPFREIFGDNYVWQNLETFLYYSGPINGADLMDFLARHATTLKTLGLHAIHPRTGSWREIFDFIKGMPELRLKKLVLIDASEELSDGGIQYYKSESDKKKMIDYVLHDGPPFPPTEAELEQQGLRGDRLDQLPGWKILKTVRRRFSSRNNTI
ncbi:hypothetical protein RUND412_000765 [Rhizina undulata]